jgi:hypothetical protein
LLIAVLIAELILERRKPLKIPFLNELYPYVMFRPPENYAWRSSEPSPSSRKGEYAIAYTNEDSLRIESPDYQLSKKKPVGQIRIAVIGGSTVHIGTRFEVTLPGALKRNLLARYPGRNIEVINAGIISAISRQELILLITTLVDYELDILVIYDGINDSGQMLYFERRPNFPYHYGALENAWSEYLSGIRGPAWKQIMSRSAIAQTLWPSRFTLPYVPNRALPEEIINDSYLRQTYADAYLDNWNKIARVCGAYNIEPFFVLQPTSLYGLFPNGRLSDYDSPALYANYLVYEDFREEVRRFAKQKPELGVLDLSNFLPDPTRFYDGAHVYDEVNDTIAEEIAGLISPRIDASSDRVGLR